MGGYRYYPNRLSTQASSGSTSWKLLGADGAFYDTNVAALAAGTHPWPGSPQNFPRGVPRVIVQTLAASGNAAGSECQVATNTLIAPTTPDADVPAGDPLVLDDSDVKSIWIKQTVTGDITSVKGFF